MAAISRPAAITALLLALSPLSSLAQSTGGGAGGCKRHRPREDYFSAAERKTRKMNGPARINLR
jgi:hypothetical protein